MIINIYGVGRSATKSCLIQAIRAAELSGHKVWVNYEPYYWQDIKARRPNYFAAKVHEETPLILMEDERFVGNDDFLESLLDGGSDDSVVISKFIRGLGRIPRINEIMKPDINVLVVRNLYSQLSSIFAARWDLLGQGLRHKNDSQRFVEEVERSSDRVPYAEELVKSLKNRLDINALYWYVMNWLAIDGLAKERTIIIGEGGLHINDLGKTLSGSVFFAGGEGDFYSLVPGHEVHGDRVFRSSNKSGLLEIINAGLYSVFNKNRFCLYSKKIGSRVESVNFGQVESGLGSAAYSEYGGKGKLRIERNELYDLMINEIEKKVASVVVSEL